MTVICAAILTVAAALDGDAGTVRLGNAEALAAAPVHERGEPTQRVRARLPGEGDVVLALRQVPVVHRAARVEVGGDDRREDPALTAALHDMVHLQGTAEGFPNSNAYLALGRTGIAATVDLGQGRGLFMLRAAGEDRPGLCAGPSEFVRVAGVAAPDVPGCALDVVLGDTADGTPPGMLASLPPGHRTVRLGVDADDDFCRIFPTAEAAAEYVAAVVGAVSSIYRRDCDAHFELSYLRLLPEGSNLFNQSDPLVPFRNYWRANGADVPRDLMTLFTGRRNLPYGGVAYLSVACNADFGYSVNGYLIGRFVQGASTDPGNWDINVVAHELGHNLGTRHTHDYGLDGCNSGAVRRGTIMSYCHVVSGAGSNVDLFLHRVTARYVREYLPTAACLELDCDDDGVADADEIAADPTLDSNGDALLDACQDCDADGTPDPVQVAAGDLPDANGNGLPDGCEPDCDADGVPDADEIDADPSIDANGDGVLATCEPDCDGNGTADSDDLIADMGRDRSRDGTIDACEDCDEDGIDDFAALQGSRSRWVGSAADALLRELDPRSGVVRRTVAVGTEPIADLAVDAGGRIYAAAGPQAWIFDRAVDLEAARPFGPALPAPARSVAIAPDGRVAVLLATGEALLVAADGSGAGPWVPAFSEGDARDLAFRRRTDGSWEAFVSLGAGTVERIAWPSGAREPFADLTAGAPGLRGILPLEDGSILVAAGALDNVQRIGPAGEPLGRWDVQASGLANGAYAIAEARDGRTVLVTGTTAGSTINGYNARTGYNERTFRVYPADAPAATALVIAPPSATDRDGNLVPDRCERSPADLDGNGRVDGADLVLLLNAWGECPRCPADLDGDGQVGGADLVVVLASWNP